MDIVDALKRVGNCLVWLLVLLLPVTLTARAAAPELLLLTKYRPGMEISGWYMSEKLDGIRAYWDGKKLLSRQGNPFAAPAWFTEKLPPFELDGELWIARGHFEETLSITSRDRPHPGWRRLTYNIFEIPHAPGGLDARLGQLRRYLQQHPIAHVGIVPQALCRDADHLMARLKSVDADGAEGLVLRNPATPYETGRSPNALKVKRFDDMEGRVVGYRPGKGKYTGMTGALWVEIEGGIRFYVGSGLTDRDRAEPPLIGSVITFRHQGLTRNGIPRFASFLRVREGPR
uniref:DNA ligase-1 n=1 Tax=Candidatus Kentrum sp. SD TaxID=2126332 RepID=A0A451BSE9_9GAMM|nr:MAG: DNA ligase-1 [Candidatus Kentron sp. SD]VFK49925.1 MAG: DNA ligase-1 [Candidatus Kentron sp. SD]VFK81205.1 MAG: DNA ligase-1 [Candidatus Kentron sp. SD]